MILNIEPSDIMTCLNILLFIGNVAIHLAIRKREKSKIDGLTETNSSLVGSVNVLADVLDKAIKQRVIDNAVSKAIEEIPIE